MKLIERPTCFPSECLFTHSADGPMIDFEVDYDSMAGPGSRQYMKVSYAKEIAEFLGYRSPREVESLRDELKIVRGDLAFAQEELAELREFKRSFDYAMDKSGMTLKSKPGRKPVNAV